MRSSMPWLRRQQELCNLSYWRSLMKRISHMFLPMMKMERGSSTLPLPAPCQRLLHCPQNKIVGAVAPCPDPPPQIAVSWPHQCRPRLPTQWDVSFSPHRLSHRHSMRNSKWSWRRDEPVRSEGSTSCRSSANLQCQTPSHRSYVFILCLLGGTQGTTNYRHLLIGSFRMFRLSLVLVLMCMSLRARLVGKHWIRFI